MATYKKILSLNNYYFYRIIDKELNISFIAQLHKRKRVVQNEVYEKIREELTSFCNFMEPMQPLPIMYFSEDALESWHNPPES